MATQNFSAKNFGFLTRRGDYRDYFTDTRGSNEATKKEVLQKIEDELDIESYTFQPLRSFEANQKRVYSLPKILKDKSNRFDVTSDDYILRQINRNLQRIYKVKQADRFQIISSVKTLLINPAPFYVCKLDIKSFYENVDRQKVLKNIESSALVSYQTKKLLKSFFSNLPLQEGLPRGINISATLAEYCLKKFDKKISNMESIYYYARFVDDIIIFSTGKLFSSKKVTDQTIKKIDGVLPYGLRLNMDKIKIHDLSKDTAGKDVCISYLGYEFKCSKNGSEVELKTRITKKKMNKIKGRLVSSFLAYKTDQNFNLLKDRLLFLTVTYPLKTRRGELSRFENAGLLHGGILYSYPLIDDLSCLSDLDRFLRGILFSKSMKNRISDTLTETERAELKKFSFLQGYNRRIHRVFEPIHIECITRCWR